MSSELKKVVGYAIVDQVIKSGQKIGLGTGSTAYFAMERIAQKIISGELTKIKIVPTSFQTTTVMQGFGIPVYSLNDPAIQGELDVAIDGADEVDPNNNLTKGGGGAHLLEKLVEYNSKAFYVMIDESKLVQDLGDTFPIPVEFIPESRVTVEKSLKHLGGEPTLRMAIKKAGPIITDSGNMIYDVRFPGGITKASGQNPQELERTLQTIVGVVEVGLFTRPVAGVFVADSQGNVRVIS
jgi:ribose 5-phosphate isomerase A